MKSATFDTSIAILRTAMLVVGVALVSLAMACDDGSSTEPAPTDTAALATDLPTQAPPATPTSGGSAIRSIDFSTQPPVQEFIRQNGGLVDPSAVLYADLTGDGAEEAIVPISSGGTMGNLAILVFMASYTGVAYPVILHAEPSDGGGIIADLQEGQLFTDEASYGPSDPDCCPSLIVRTYYVWNGSALVVEREEQIPATPIVR